MEPTKPTQKYKPELGKEDLNRREFNPKDEVGDLIGNSSTAKLGEDNTKLSGNIDYGISGHTGNVSDQRLKK
jgi:hypothetical protein